MELIKRMSAKRTLSKKRISVKKTSSTTNSSKETLIKTDTHTHKKKKY